MNELEIGNETPKQKKVVDNLEKFYHYRKEVINLF